MQECGLPEDPFVFYYLFTRKEDENSQYLENLKNQLNNISTNKKLIVEAIDSFIRCEFELGNIDQKYLNSWKEIELEVRDAIIASNQEQIDCIYKAFDNILSNSESIHRNKFLLIAHLPDVVCGNYHEDNKFLQEISNIFHKPILSTKYLVYTNNNHQDLTKGEIRDCLLDKIFNNSTDASLKYKDIIRDVIKEHYNDNEDIIPIKLPKPVLERQTNCNSFISSSSPQAFDLSTR